MRDGAGRAIRRAPLRPSAATARPARRGTSAATTTSGSTTARSTSRQRRAAHVDGGGSTGRPHPADDARGAEAPGGRFAAPTADAGEQRRHGERGAYDNPENSTSRRAVHPGLRLVSGPPMQPVPLQQLQADRADADHVMILVEMDHDTRIISVPEDAWSGERTGSGSATRSAVGRRHTGRRDDQLHDQDPLPGRDRTPQGHRAVHRGWTTRPCSTALRSMIRRPGHARGAANFRSVMAKAGEQLHEYACHEGNHSFTGIMKGDRLLDGERGRASRAQSNFDFARRKRIKGR